MDLREALQQYATGQPKPLDPQVQGALEASFPPPTPAAPTLVEQLEASLEQIHGTAASAPAAGTAAMERPQPLAQCTEGNESAAASQPAGDPGSPAEAPHTAAPAAEGHVVAVGEPQSLPAPLVSAAPPPDLDAPEYIWEHPFHFVTGAAGSGKTYLTRQRVAQSAPGSTVLMASTGIAAVNLGDAVTINSQLGYFDTSSMVQNFTHGMLQQKLRRLRQAGVRRLILDEISMVEAEQLTCLVRAINELNSEATASKAGANYFGDPDADNKQLGLTLVGDFLQLPPVQGDYAFLSPEWHHFTPGIERLTEIRRQGNADFIEALRACRAEQPDLVCAYFADKIQRFQDSNFQGTTIVAKNAQVDRLNQLRHDHLPGKPEEFETQRWGKERGEWKNIPPKLLLKPTAQVMILSNRYDGDAGMRELVYANGDNAVFLGKNEAGDAMVQMIRTGATVPVKWITRDNKQPRAEPRYVCSNQQCGHEARDGKVKRCEYCGASIKKDLFEVIGEITYMPLRLAYASTVHKTQGLTLDQVQITISDPFFTSPSMLYVALSRARGPEGLRLVGNLDMLRARCKMDPRVRAWR
jgi:hypothetical protein